MANKKLSSGISRRDLLKVAGAGAMVTALLGAKPTISDTVTEEEVSNVTSDQALQMLKQGNQRHVGHKLTHPHQTAQRLAEVAKVQHPFAIVLGCADSRVPPEIVFDRGLGDLFVIRVAGNIVDDAIVGSIEYAVEELGVPLIMVLGHQRCGAISAALKGGAVPGHISTLVQAIQPAVASVKSLGGDPVDNAVKANIKIVVAKLKNSMPIVSEFVNSGKLKIVGGRYDLDTGRVDIIA